MRVIIKRSAVYAGVAAVTMGLTLLAVRARAAGVPDADVLTYTGYLEDPEGKPITTELSSVGIEVFDAAEAGKRVCDTSVESVTPVHGRFQLPLPEECLTAVKATANLWVDVKVEGASLGRTKLGAVPYAVEAGHATSADGAKLADDASHATKADSATKATKADTATSASTAVDPAAGGTIESRFGTLEKKTTTLRSQITAAEDATLGGFVAPCLAGLNNVTNSCTVAAGRKCRALGYVGGYYEGESDGTFRTITCTR
jgi:hypothetical protein